MKIKKIWENREKILEGIKNRMFKKEHVEAVYNERMAICKQCPALDVKGSDCLVPGTQPCCSECGCSLDIKLRSLSSGCGNEAEPKWHALLTQEEEDTLSEQLNEDDE